MWFNINSRTARGIYSPMRRAPPFFTKRKEAKIRSGATLSMGFPRNPFPQTTKGVTTPLEPISQVQEP